MLVQLPCSSWQLTMIAQGFEWNFRVLHSTLLLKLLLLLFSHLVWYVLGHL